VADSRSPIAPLNPKASHAPIRSVFGPVQRRAVRPQRPRH